MTYNPEELAKLQATLYRILQAVADLCDRHGIRYFITGGTAIGAHFWGHILPWDDDIDIGMMRPDYERFLQIAQQELGSDYFVQTPQTDPHVPFFFAKVRLNGTLFCESTFQHIDMHQGIYIDVFPFDKIPESKRLEQWQHKALFFLNGLFIAKEIWQWKYCGHCDIPEPRPRGFLPCLGSRILVTLLSKRVIFRLMHWVQTLFNGKDLPYCKNIITRSERVLISDIKQARKVTLGPLSVFAPRDILTYLNNHYGSVRKDIPEEQRVNHRPAQLKFAPIEDGENEEDWHDDLYANIKEEE